MKPSRSQDNFRKPNMGLRLLLSAAALLLETAPTPLPAQGAEVPLPTRLTPIAQPSGTRTAPPRSAAALTLDQVRTWRELPLDRWLRSGEFYWNDDGVPAGPTAIVVNIRARTLSAYRAGREVGRSSLIYGSSDKPTPIGTFRILQKDARHVSRTYGNAPMPYAMRLTGDGVSIHGSEMRDDYATHGCIGLPKGFAQMLFASAHIGDPVLVWRGTEELARR
jgi:hypothetical protein